MTGSSQVCHCGIAVTCSLAALLAFKTRESFNNTSRAAIALVSWSASLSDASIPPRTGRATGRASTIMSSCGIKSSSCSWLAAQPRTIDNKASKTIGWTSLLTLFIFESGSFWCELTRGTGWRARSTIPNCFWRRVKSASRIEAFCASCARVIGNTSFRISKSTILPIRSIIAALISGCAPCAALSSPKGSLSSSILCWVLISPISQSGRVESSKLSERLPASLACSSLGAEVEFCLPMFG
mmetsp:Transcript_21305/g.39663  ORF Transcript_21305/g.39663 Transcript_21305/m.39663 type:complete len:241 (+) Transcript_21305:222-944(+)